MVSGLPPGRQFPGLPMILPFGVRPARSRKQRALFREPSVMRGNAQSELAQEPRIIFEKPANV